MLYKGLNDNEVKASLIKHGANILKTKSESTWRLILHQFSNPITFLLIGAGVISYLLKDYEESLVIFIILLVNGTIGYSQEYRSKQLISKISSFITSRVEVVRNSKRQSIDKAGLVVDDIVILKLGDVVPADCILLKSDDLRVNESILTGESEEVYKSSLVLLREARQEKHIVYAGSSISHGYGLGKVINVGKSTRFGMISHLALNTKKPSQFEKNSESLSRGFSMVGVVFLFIILGLQLIIKPDGLAHWTQLALFTITLTTSLIPEALPIVTSLAIAQKALGLGKRGVVIRHLTALEDLGNIDVLCTDKTGTLTENKQTVINSTIEKSSVYDYIYKLAVDSSENIDIAIIDWLSKKKKLPTKNTVSFSDYADIPFDPQVRISGRIFKEVVIYKGSTESILDFCDQDGKKRETILKNVKEKSRNGLRALSFAIKNKVSGEKIYLGTIYLADEIKSDADDIVRSCAANEVELKILTGDSLEVAFYIAQKAGLVSNIDECIDASELPFHDQILLEHIINSKKVFARTKPQDKYAIIKVLQKSHVVGYLGDGINDAPALALAQVGMVVDTATDIAKSSADIILLKHELKTIITGIREGRAVFENIQKYLKFTLIGNFGNAFTIGLISLLLPFEPILAIQVLIINLLTDIPMLAISGDSVDKGWLKSPKKQEMYKLLLFCVVLGLVSTVFDFIFFALNKSLPPGQIQTSWFFFSICTELFLIFMVRSRKGLLQSSMPHQSLLVLILLSFGVGIWLTVSGFSFINITVLSLPRLLPLFGLALLYLIATEIIKQFFHTLFYSKYHND